MDNNQPLSLLLATDGSQASKVAFYVLQAVEFYEHQNLFSKLIVTHISDPAKDYLPFEYQSNTIYEDYRIELLSRYPQHKYQLLFESKNLIDENIRDQLLNLAKANSVAYIVIGYHGRKGVKLDVTIIGQTVKHSAYNSQIPLIITKTLYKREPEKQKGFNFLVCVDGSKKSIKCATVAVQLAFDKNDKIVVCFAPTPDSVKFTTMVKTKIEEFMENVQRNWEFMTLQPSFQNVEQIIQFINKNEQISIDFVVFGTNGYRAQMEGKSFFGSTSEQILIKALANPIIIP